MSFEQLFVQVWAMFVKLGRYKVMDILVVFMDHGKRLETENGPFGLFLMTSLNK